MRGSFERICEWWTHPKHCNSNAKDFRPNSRIHKLLRMLPCNLLHIIWAYAGHSACVPTLQPPVCFKISTRLSPVFTGDALPASQSQVLPSEHCIQTHETSSWPNQRAQIDSSCHSLVVRFPKKRHRRTDRKALLASHSLPRPASHSSLVARLGHSRQFSSPASPSPRCVNDHPSGFS